MLSERETNGLRLLARGLANKQIGRQLVIAEKTVQSHVSSILGKLGLRSTTAAMLAIVVALLLYVATGAQVGARPARFSGLMGTSKIQTGARGLLRGDGSCFPIWSVLGGQRTCHSSDSLLTAPAWGRGPRPSAFRSRR